MNEELLEDMLGLPDADFIESAYLMILSRVPDSDGMKNYLLELILGNSRKAVLFALCNSEEGIRNGVVHSADLQSFFARRAGSGDENEKRKTGRLKRKVKRILARTLFCEEYDSLIESKIELFRIRKENSHEMKVQKEFSGMTPVSGTVGRREAISELPNGVYDDFIKLSGGIF